MPAASVESAVEKLFLVKGRKKRAAKSDPAKPPVKRSKKNVEITEVSRPIVSGARFTNQVVSLSYDGVLKIDGVEMIRYNKATMDLIKKLGINRSKLYIKNSSCGYLYLGQDALHYILGAALKEQHFESLVARGFTGSIDDLTHVSHNDDNFLNNNLSNLLNLLAAWNQNLKKARKVQQRGKSYYCQVTIGESDTYQTVYVDNPDESLLQYGT
jgi:hypothetical protein